MPAGQRAASFLTTLVGPLGNRPDGKVFPDHADGELPSYVSSEHRKEVKEMKKAMIAFALVILGAVGATRATLPAGQPATTCCDGGACCDGGPCCGK